MTARLPFFALALGMALLTACSSDDQGDRPSEAVSSLEWNGALALTRDGDFIYVARITELDRIDVRTGALTKLAGSEYAACPNGTGARWSSLALDRTYPMFAVHSDSVFLGDERCGVWAWDLGTHRSRLLVDAKAKWNDGGRFRWSAPWGMSFVPDGDGLMACFAAIPTDGERLDNPLLPYLERVEVWSLAADGTPRERFWKGESAAGFNYCSKVAVDARSIIVATQAEVVVVDRASRRAVSLGGGLKYGTAGLVADAERVYWIGDNTEIVSASREGGPLMTLVPGATKGTDPSRALLAMDGDELYFYEGSSLKRLPKLGGKVEDFAAGSQANWAFPVIPAFSDSHVYFERAIEMPRKVIEPETGAMLDAKYDFTLRRSPK